MRPGRACNFRNSSLERLVRRMVSCWIVRVGICVAERIGDLKSTVQSPQSAVKIPSSKLQIPKWIGLLAHEVEVIFEA